MILILNSLSIMSDHRCTVSVSIVLEWSHSIEIEYRILARHCELHSETWKSCSLSEIAAVLHILDTLDCTVCVHLECKRQFSDTLDLLLLRADCIHLDRCKCSRHEVVIISSSHLESLYLEFRIEPVSKTGMELRAVVVLCHGPTETWHQRLCNHLVLSYHITCQCTLLCIENSLPSLYTAVIPSKCTCKSMKVSFL